MSSPEYCFLEEDRECPVFYDMEDYRTKIEEAIKEDSRSGVIHSYVITKRERRMPK
jgi:hypothetical protein